MFNKQITHKEAIDSVLEVCRALHQKGISPSSALVKAKLSVPLPLPQIIAGLKYWQANPELHAQPVSKQPSESSAHSKPSEEDNEPSNAQQEKTVDIQARHEIQGLKNQVTQLEDALRALQTQVRALKPE